MTYRSIPPRSSYTALGLKDAVAVAAAVAVLAVADVLNDCSVLLLLVAAAACWEVTLGLVDAAES